MFIFPGLGLGSILSEAKEISNEMIHAAATTLSESLNEDENQREWLYPSVLRIREISKQVAKGVIRQAQQQVMAA